jgi:nucleoporin GLE1
LDASLNSGPYKVHKIIAMMPPPTKNAVDHMPTLTIYLLNILAKAALAQCSTEAGANPRAADPIGQLIVTVFAQHRFCFNGKPLIDIVMAKLRIMCPVLFGVRGNDKTEEGRAKLGWKKDSNGNWISEQEHNDRMTGLGAGYAAICLRDFSRSSLANPWASHNYWYSLAMITLTPPEQTSSTQFVVLKAMVDNYVTQFLRIYGDMGLRALHVVLEEFPRKAPAGNVAASSLKVLAAKLVKDTGLVLAAH